MDRRLVGILSLAGVVMGVVSVLGWIQRIEFVLWLVIAISSAFVIAREAPRSFFLHGFWTGLLAGIASPLIQCAMFPTYLANNPESAAQMQTMPASMNPRFLLMIFAPIIGLANGAVVGLLSWIASKMIKQRVPGGA